MITSTPLINNNDLRRSAILRDATNQNSNKSKKRLSSVIHQSLDSVNEVDDELERSIRRNEADIQRRLSNISIPQSPPVGNEKEIRDHFQICLKMFAENKICSKNAWNLRIIDYMRTVLQLQGLAKDSLQVASTSLDASAKIYSIRVDDIHKEVLKLANNMARLGAQKGAEIIDDNGNGNDDLPENPDETVASKRKKKRKVGQKPTVAKDPNSLVLDIPKLESVFFQTHSNMESSSIDNLFTNKLPLNYSCYKFMHLSKEAAWPTYDKIDPNVKFDKVYPFKVKELKNFQTCGPFADFAIDEWDPEQEDQLMMSQKASVPEEVVFDADGIPIPELDASVHDLFANHNIDNMSSDEEEKEGIDHPIIQTNTVSHIVDFKTVVTNGETNEYSFMGAVPTRNNKLITQIWAGPSHWKLKHVRPAIARCLPENDKQPITKSVKKVKAPPALVDFYNNNSDLGNSKLHKGKRSRIDDNPLRITLPEVVVTDGSIKQSLILKNVMLCVNKLKETTENEDQGEVQPYNYENPNDSLYCSQHAMDDDDDHQADDPNVQNDEDVLPAQNFLGDNLIDMPQLTQNTYIPYALQAKKMDMKKLKCAVWKTLIGEKPNQVNSEKDTSKKEVQKSKFSSVYNELPTQIPDKMKKELSSPLAFVALLHLCNEENLFLAKEGDDIIIEQRNTFTI